MENNKWIVMGEYLVQKPEMQKPHKYLSQLGGILNEFYPAQIERYTKALSSQPRIKRGEDNWTEGQELEEGKDFETDWEPVHFFGGGDTAQLVAIPIKQ